MLFYYSVLFLNYAKTFFMDKKKRLAELKGIYSVTENSKTVQANSCTTIEEAEKLSPKDILELSHAAKQLEHFSSEVSRMIEE